MSALHHIPADAPLQHRIGELLARHMAGADMLGRVQIVREVHRKTGKVVPIATSSRHRHQFADDQQSDASLGFSFDIPNTAAADYIRGLTPVTKETFDGLSTQYKRDAFTISGASDVKLIEKVRDELATAAAKGTTSPEFQRAVKQITSDAGVADLSAFTLDTAFNVQMQKAYSRGRYEQMSEPDTIAVLPYWQYWTVGDDRVRPEHRVLHLFTARGVDPVWRKIYPPNGFNCRCAVVPVLPDEAPEDADTPGMERLPMLAMTLVPQPGFMKVFAEKFASSSRLAL